MSIIVYMLEKFRPSIYKV